jgi:hypothetical protein
MPVSKFKATCLAVLEDVRKTRTPIRVTRFGKPIADVMPPAANPSGSWLGCMRETMEVTGDLVEPVHAFDDWKAARR